MNKENLFFAAVFVIGGVNLYFHWKSSKKLDEIKKMINEKV
jgi:hypothetical protein